MFLPAAYPALGVSVAEGAHQKTGENGMSEAVYIKRFNAYERILHIVVAVSFLGAVASGMPLKYAETGWASKFMQVVFGSYQTAGVVHRVCAVVIFGYFFAHIRLT